MKPAICLLCLLLAPALLAAGPVIKFKSTKVDFGEAESGKIVDIAFEFVNAGDAQLVLKSVVPSCGCTSSEIKKMNYAPGERGVIPVKFNTTGYSGKVQKLVTVLSNDGQNPEMRLIIGGTVTLKDFAQADLDTEQLAFGKVQRGKSYTRKVTLTNNGTIDLRVVEVCAAPEANVSFAASLVPPKQSTEITVIFTPFLKGAFSTLVKIRTNDTRRAYLFLRLDAEIE